MRYSFMFWLSLVAAVLTVSVNAPGTGDFGAALSAELARGSPIPLLLILSLCGVIGALVRKLLRRRDIIRAILLALIIPGLIVISVTSPDSFFHAAVFYLMTAGSILWFALMGLEHDDQFITIGAAAAAVLIPLGYGLSVGFSEKAFILYTLISGNLLYYGHFAVGRKRPRPPKRNPWDEYVI